MFCLTMHSKHLFNYMVLDIWTRTTPTVRMKPTAAISWATLSD